MNKDDFLGRIRKALHREAISPIEAPPALLSPLTDWDNAALVEQFCDELTQVGAQVHRVATVKEARDKLVQLLVESGAKSYIRSSDALVDEVAEAVSLPLAQRPEQADIGISTVTFGIANTGTLVLSSEVGRQASLLPMTYIALIYAEQIVPSMTEALTLYQRELPSAWVQATGPSRTADIELTLTTGVHGPGVVKVILIAKH